MDANLESLIEKIKSEGIEEAEKAAEEKLQEAEEKAGEIVETAEKEAEAIVKKAEQKANQLKQSGEEALKQARRDTILVTRERITEILDKIFEKRLEESLTPEFIREIVGKVIGQLGADDSYELTVPEAKLEKLSKLLLDEGADALDGEKIELLPDRELEAGIKIKVEGDDVYYDLSARGIASYLNQFLNPAIQKILSDSD